MYKALTFIGAFIRSNFWFSFGVLLLLNLLAFCLFAYDKLCAVKKQRRIPEFALLASAVLYGAVGAFFAMGICRHKTKSVKFLLSVPPLAMLQLVLLALAVFG